MTTWNLTKHVVACVELLALGATCVAADAALSLSPRDLDVRIDQSIVRTINIGAPIFNQGDHAGCYRLYQGALLMMEPMLQHRAELRQVVGAGLRDAEVLPTAAQRATELRRILDRVLAAVRTPLASSPPQPPPQSLWVRLGGEPAVRAVVHDFVALAASDPQVDLTRGGRYPLDAAGIASLERRLVELVSAASGGPLKYQGRPMREAHRGMGITAAQFDALAGDLAVVLTKYNVPPKEAGELLAIVASTRKDIVEASAPGPASSMPPNPAAGLPLWTRLGSESAVKAVVHDFVALAVSDPQVDLTRGGRHPLDAAGIANLERRLVELVSAVSGGPLKYEGRPMKQAHAGMGITAAQFDALAGDLKVVLTKHSVPQKEAGELLAIIASTRQDIVEAGPAPPGP
jgi:hemoglobin